MIETDRLIAPETASPQEEAIERALRPKVLDEYVGQEKARAQLEIFINAARGRSEALDHVLLFGPPGLGKTTLAHIIAREMGVNLRQTSGPVLERAGDLAALLTNLEPNDVLFIDEIHRLSPVVEEILYPAMEDYRLDIMIGEGPAARSVRLDLPPFTLVGATTRAGMLTNPLRDRFGIVSRLEFYTAEELGRIVHRSAGLLEVQITATGAFEVAKRSRGTPRIADAPLDARYGDEALALMLQAMVARGVQPRDCEAKLFGGGSMFPQQALQMPQRVGRRNGHAAHALLEAQGIRLVSRSLFGEGHRRIVFDIASGHVWHRQHEVPEEPADQRTKQGSPA